MDVGGGVGTNVGEGFAWGDVGLKPVPEHEQERAEITGVLDPGRRARRRVAAVRGVEGQPQVGVQAAVDDGWRVVVVKLV
jgi:hypothetical protein